MGGRVATKVVAMLVLAWALGGCAFMTDNGPDQSQRDAWNDAVVQASSRFTSVEVSGTMKDGFTSYTYISVTLDSPTITQDEVQDLITAIGTSTEDAHRDHQMRAGFSVLDPNTSTGIALVDLTDVADESMVFRTGTMLIFSAGGE